MSPQLLHTLTPPTPHIPNLDHTIFAPSRKCRYIIFIPITAQNFLGGRLECLDRSIWVLGSDIEYLDYAVCCARREHRGGMWGEGCLIYLGGVGWDRQE